MARPKVKTPPFRKLKGYAFDPSLSLDIDKAFINRIVYKVPWENPYRKSNNDPKDDKGLREGPIGEYLEVIDYDPTIKKYFLPVDLNDHNLLGQDGLDPSESNPQFHQQMVYAVAMTTIRNFENALGRQVIWGSHAVETKIVDKTAPPKRNGKPATREIIVDNYVPRLRIYPHAMREANAYYSPQKKALLFGYFSAQPAEVTIEMPNALTFTCLSHDIIAHETTHAILDGMYHKYTEDTNPDVLAFHEAFADIVALFQHFTFPEVLKHQIAQTRGDLTTQNLLGQLAQQFGAAIGGYGALRDAIGAVNPETKKWEHKEPTGSEYVTTFEPHARGSILVSAVFDAFLTIYKARAADLLRIASGGSGILPEGQLHPDLVNRLANEASKTASHVLRMCIRALDYSPPLDITYGDYLRAIITADTDIVADDPLNYRLAFISAFRRRGIYPTGIKSLSVESLSIPEVADSKLEGLFQILARFLREFSSDIMYETERRAVFNITRDYITGRYSSGKIIYGLHRRFYEKFDDSPEFELLTGMIFNKDYKKFGVRESKSHGGSGPAFGISSLRLASRVGLHGDQSNRIILGLTQRIGVMVEEKDGEPRIKTFIPNDKEPLPKGGFTISGGATMIFDLDTLKLKYVITKPLLDMTELANNKRHLLNRERILKMHEYLHGPSDNRSLYEAYYGMGKQYPSVEPFCFLHNH